MTSTWPPPPGCTHVLASTFPPPIHTHTLNTHRYVRGLPAIESTFASNSTSKWCLHIDVWPENMTCRLPPNAPAGNTRSAMHAHVSMHTFMSTFTLLYHAHMIARTLDQRLTHVHSVSLTARCMVFAQQRIFAWSVGARSSSLALRAPRALDQGILACFVVP
jgi:hypothetical protein